MQLVLHEGMSLWLVVDHPRPNLGAGDQYAPHPQGVTGVILQGVPQEAPVEV